MSVLANPRVSPTLLERNPGYKPETFREAHSILKLVGRQRGRSPRQRFYSAKIGQKSKDANISERGIEEKGENREMGTQMEGLLTE